MDIYRQVLPVPMENPWGGDPEPLTRRNRGVIIVNIGSTPNYLTLQAKSPTGTLVPFTVHVAANTTLTIPLVSTHVNSAIPDLVFVYEIF